MPELEYVMSSWKHNKINCRKVTWIKFEELDTHWLLNEVKSFGTQLRDENFQLRQLLKSLTQTSSKWIDNKKNFVTLRQQCIWRLKHYLYNWTLYVKCHTHALETNFYKWHTHRIGNCTNCVRVRFLLCVHLCANECVYVANNSVQLEQNSTFFMCASSRTWIQILSTRGSPLIQNAILRTCVRSCCMNVSVSKSELCALRTTTTIDSTLWHRALYTLRRHYVLLLPLEHREGSMYGTCTRKSKALATAFHTFSYLPCSRIRLMCVRTTVYPPLCVWAILPHVMRVFDSLSHFHSNLSCVCVMFHWECEWVKYVKGKVGSPTLQITHQLLSDSTWGRAKQTTRCSWFVCHCLEAKRVNNKE